MKMIGTYTVRGQVLEADGTPDRIRLFDGRFDTGYKVVDFVVWGASPNSSSNPDVCGKLGTTDNLETSALNFFNAGDAREIAWSGSAGSSDTMFNAPPGKIIDLDNFIVEDLFVYVRGPGNAFANYMVTLEKYDTNDAMGALAMVRNNVQNVIGDN